LTDRDAGTKPLKPGLSRLKRDVWYAYNTGSCRPGVGSLGPAGRIRPVAPLPNCSNCMARLVVLYFMNLPSLQLLVWHTYEKPHWAINVLYVAFWAFIMNCENLELIWLKFPKFPSFINNTGNVIVGGKLYLVEFVFGPKLGKGCRPLL